MNVTARERSSKHTGKNPAPRAGEASVPTPTRREIQRWAEITGGDMSRYAYQGLRNLGLPDPDNIPGLTAEITEWLQTSIREWTPEVDKTIQRIHRLEPALGGQTLGILLCRSAFLARLGKWKSLTSAFR